MKKTTKTKKPAVAEKPVPTTIAAKALFGDHNEVHFVMPLGLTNAEYRKEARKQFPQIAELTIYPDDEPDGVMLIVPKEAK